MTPIHTETYRGYDIAIYQDEASNNPNEWEDRDLFLVAFHPQFTVTTTDIGKTSDIQGIQHTHHAFMLEAYIHSGVVLALAGSREAARFPDRRWDVSAVGAVLVAKTVARARAKARVDAQSLVDSWNDYLTGNVYGYDITKDGGHINSVWGYYGDYAADGGALAEARQAVDAHMAYRPSA